MSNTEYRHRWSLLLTVMIGSVASIMSSTIMNVAVPDMSRHFVIGQELVHWVSSGFMVAMTVSMLTTPWLLSRYGYYRTYCGAIGLLLVGGIGGGLASAFGGVLVARVAEGLACGVLQPIPSIIILRVFSQQAQGRASGIFGTGVVLAPAIGPSIGGLLVDWFSWRSTFFLVVPFCVAAYFLARRYMPEARAILEPAQRGKSGLDWLGLFLATAATLCLLTGLVSLQRAPVLQWATLLLLSTLAAVLFVKWQHRLSHIHRGPHQQAPLMNLALFRHQQFAMGTIVSFIYGTAIFGSTYLLPVYLQMGLGFSASYVGTLMLPAGLMLALTISVVGELSSRFPTHWLVSIGLVLLSLGFLLMVTVGLGTAIGWIILWVVLGRIGLGFILPSLNIGSMRGLSKGLIAQGSSVISFMRMVGGAAGVTLCALVLEWRLTAYGQSLASTVITPQRLQAFDEAFLMLAVISALAVLAAWRVREEVR